MWGSSAILIAPREFNELVNMTASELEKWLKEEESEASGWSKDDGSGETIGHERFGFFQPTNKEQNLTFATPAAARSLRS